MRVQQKVGEKGSLKWMQELVRRHRDVLNSAVGRAIELAPGETIEWRSPLEDDEFAEYRDGEWLKRIGRPDLADELKAFWPSRGPQWDALGTTSLGRIILVEAKAHTAEVKSPPSAASSGSAQRIAKALDEVKAYLGISATVSWTGRYYQYANRLAHLYFLRRNRVNAHLVFLYLVGDHSMGKAATMESWGTAIDEAHEALGIRSRPDSVHAVFIDVSALA